MALENTVISLMCDRRSRAKVELQATDEGRSDMQLYGILRRNGWATAADLEVAGKRSAEVGDKEGSGVRWIRSYVLAEESGEVGTFCVYEGESPEAIRAHADEAGLPADEVIAIADTVIVRPDPAPVGS
jgi:sporulation protein YlmC with PRC-barrel domain